MLADKVLARQRWTPTDPAGVSPSGERPSFLAVRRQVLVWLFQDVVLWLIVTNHIPHFRPTRISRSRTRPAMGQACEGRVVQATPLTQRNPVRCASVTR